MPRKVLIVTSDTHFITQLNKVLTPFETKIELTFINTRIEALEILKTATFDFIITAIKIPRVTDGYRFLSQIVDKTIKANKILILVDNNPDEVRKSVKTLGITLIFSILNIEEISKAIIRSSGISSSQDNKEALGLEKVTHDHEKIIIALNLVMGPVGRIIYKKAINAIQEQSNTDELIQSIAFEINDEEKIALFYENLN